MARSQMRTQATEVAKPAYRPTAEQQARARALQRFNRWYFFLPLGVMGLLLVGLFVSLLWATLMAGEGIEQRAREIASGVADIVVILVTLPLTLVCLLLPAAAVGLAIYDRGRERTRIAALQQLIWQGERKFDWLANKIQRFAPKVVQPIVQLNAKLAYFGTIIMRLKRILFGR